MKFIYGVDIQNDFMNKDGRLYVEGAEEIKPKINAINVFARQLNIRRVFSRDRHFPNDDEFLIFPKHCMDRQYASKNEKGNYGIDLISEAGLGDFDTVQYKVGLNETIQYGKKDIRRFGRLEKDLILEKQDYSVFSNSNAKKVLDRLRTSYDGVVVYGVATNFCVLEATMGLQNLGFQTYLLEDAIAGVPDNFEHIGIEDAINKMVDNGTILTRTEDLTRLF